MVYFNTHNLYLLQTQNKCIYCHHSIGLEISFIDKDNSPIIEWIFSWNFTFHYQINCKFNKSNEHYIQWIKEKKRNVFSFLFKWMSKGTDNLSGLMNIIETMVYLEKTLSCFFFLFGRKINNRYFSKEYLNLKGGLFLFFCFCLKHKSLYLMT